jgi:hypothetical protein
VGRNLRTNSDSNASRWGRFLQEGYLLDGAKSIARFAFNVKTNTTGRIQYFKVNLCEPSLLLHVVIEGEIGPVKL